MTTGERDERCDHELLRAECGICTPRRPLAPECDDGTVFVAQFDSDCNDCGGPIHAGDDAMARHGEFLCSECMPEAPSEAGHPSADNDPFA